MDIENDGDFILDTRKTGRTNYHFDADQRSISLYSQLEWQPSAVWRLTGGLRYDHFDIHYTDKLDNRVA